jgi:putative addiction module component (TIGR02574 family)
MGKVLDKNLSEILKRSAAEKLFAVECIWENLREEIMNESPSEDQLDMMENRLKEYQKNPPKTKKWEEIKQKYTRKR